MTGALPARGKPRTRAQLRTKLDEIESLVWYSRYLPNAGSDTPADAHANARRVEARYAEAIKRIDFDEPWQVDRLEGQQAALRWALSDDWEELLPHGELYDS